MAEEHQNSLANVYKFYCGEDKMLDKDIRNIFVTAKCDIARCIFPLFSEMCPHLTQEEIED